MFNPKKLHQLKLVWTSEKSHYTDDDQLVIEHQGAKTATQSLQAFLSEERAKDAVIHLTYEIDGTTIETWLERDFYQSTVNWESYANTVGLCFEHCQVNNLRSTWANIYLKRLFGQAVTLEDCLADTSIFADMKEDERLEYARKNLAEEQHDTLLYASACCWDRYCGHISMKVYQVEDQIWWGFGAMETGLWFAFDKTTYIAAFKEVIDLINQDLVKKGHSEMNPYELGEVYTPIDYRVNQLLEKHQLDAKSFDLEQLKGLFETSTITEIDTGIYWADSLGLDIKQLLTYLNDEHNKLAEEDKHQLSWKLIDARPYFESLDLKYFELSVKAFLLYSKVENHAA